MGLLLAACITLLAPIQDADGSRPVTTVPVASTEDRTAAAGWLDGRGWRLQHLDCVALASSKSHDLVMLGDSITQSFGGDGRRTGQVARAILDELFEGLRIANMGISGDRTQHLLWRLENGCLDGPVPGSYLVAIGTNNIGHDEPGEIASGISAIIRSIRSRHPEVPILLCPILPRGFEPEDPSRLDVERVNERLSSLPEEPGVDLIDCHRHFVNEDGSLRRDRYATDGLHLAPAGYRAWGKAILGAHRLATDTEEQDRVSTPAQDD